MDCCSGPEYQTEVGLLSRAIVLQGAPSSTATSKGGHVQIMGKVREQRGFGATN
jgi:hypothetical protein